MDWNDDGLKDLITGEFHGYIRIYLNVNTDDDPVFDGYTQLQVNASTFNCGQESVPCTTDWNNDGLLDVLCGSSAGEVYLLINEGTPGSPLFNKSTFIMNGSQNLDVGSHSGPDVADWNRDGMKDLIVGHSQGFLFFFENKGSDIDPQFNGFEKLMTGSTPIDVGSDSKVCMVDWDNDGVTDILCGTNAGFLLFFHALGPLSLSGNEIHNSAVDRIDFKLNAGAINGNRTYLILGSATGTEPGITLPSGHVTLPLNWDALTNLVLSLVNTPLFENFLGTLDPNGQGMAKMTAPSFTGATGAVLHFAYLLNKPFDYVSNPVPVEIVP